MKIGSDQQLACESKLVTKTVSPIPEVMPFACTNSTIDYQYILYTSNVYHIKYVFHHIKE